MLTDGDAPEAGVCEMIWPLFDWMAPAAVTEADVEKGPTAVIEPATEALPASSNTATSVPLPSGLLLSARRFCEPAGVPASRASHDRSAPEKAIPCVPVIDEKVSMPFGLPAPEMVTPLVRDRGPST